MIKFISWDHDIILIIENNINRKVASILKKRLKLIKKTFLRNDGMMKFIKRV